MARSAAPPSRGRGASAPRGVSARDWLGGIRLSGFAVIMLGLVVLGAFVLVPSASGYIDMRQQIAQAEQGIAVTQDEIAALERERDRWHDPAYVMSEARERLYYTLPDEIVYLVEDDLPHEDEAGDPEPVDAEVEEREHDWMGTALRSIVQAGLAQQAVPEGDGVFQPTPRPEQTETPAG
ncbi:FtsB family cell division protein [Microbacterium karelineae]|uniref:FtsB family cell division protein n=1 Tax=Microbacterium karelineae TaxID=2654283 RepID=UPI001E390B92|nr:septum formation initiator family protein [Microbacterium karelineae]